MFNHVESLVESSFLGVSTAYWNQNLLYLRAVVELLWQAIPEVVHVSGDDASHL